MASVTHVSAASTARRLLKHQRQLLLLCLMRVINLMFSQTAAELRGNGVSHLGLSHDLQAPPLYPV